MKCWKCGQEIVDGTLECVYCHADQRRSIPKSEVGRAMRALYDNYGVEKVLSTPTYLVSGIGDLVEDSKKLKNQLRSAMDAGIGKLYLEQLKTSGAPDEAFDRRVKTVLTEDAGLSDRVAAEISGYFNEMIGWKEEAQDPEILRKESDYQRVYNKMDSRNLSDLQEALRLLKNLSGYKDSERLAEQCRVKINILKKEETYQQAKYLISGAVSPEALRNALLQLEQIQGYKDTEILIQQCRNKLNEFDKADRLKKEQEETEKKKRTWLIIGLVAAAFILFFVLRNNTQKQERFKLSQTQQAIDAERTAVAELHASQTQQTYLAETAVASTQIAVSVRNTQQAIAATQTKAAEPIKTPTPIPTATKVRTATPKTISAGDIITFGRYEQDQVSGADDIEWIVLTVENGRALLISKYGLEWKKYNDIKTDVTWETSTLRAWLNGDFYNSAFTSSEKVKIQEVRNSNPNTEKADGGNDTLDKVFLLSRDEYQAYRSTLLYPNILTYHLNPNGENVVKEWWLRSPGQLDSWKALFVDGIGYNWKGKPVDYLRIVRPALWLNL